MTEGKKPAEIEAEIARTRSDLSETLEALEDKLAPRQLLERGLDMVRHSMDGNSTGRIGETLRENPVPLALIGLGLGWLMLSKTGAGRSAGEYTRRLRSRAGDAAGSIGGRVRGLVERAEGTYAHAWTKREEEPRRAAADMHGGSAYGERAYGATGGERGAMAGSAGQIAEYGRHAWESAGDYAGQAGRQIGQARDRFGEFMEEYPLAVGALGFLAGAVVAASLPSTSWEDEYLGETRDDLWRQAEAAGRDVFDRSQELASTAASAAADAARDAINQTAEAVKEEAERQGFAAGEKGPDEKL
jgi:hypothetical protein